ncbi:MAG: cadherin domain-containing protein, partial [Rhodobiaceae bacterium]|nr:cadherin domain-containing protein [Rhodobiaceae bacterium]
MAKTEEGKPEGAGAAASSQPVGANPAAQGGGARDQTRLALAGVASNGLAAGDALLVERPDAGKFAIYDMDGKTALRFAFNLADCKIIVLDVDVVLVFSDDSKIILPGLALQLVMAEPVSFEFADKAVDAQDFLSLIGDVKLAEDLPLLQLSNADLETAPDDQNQQTVEVIVQQRTEAPFVPPPPDRSEEDDSDNLLRSFEDADKITATSSPATPPPEDVPDLPTGTGTFNGTPAAGLTFTLLGDDTSSSAALAGGGLEIRGAASTTPATTDPDYAVQSASEMLAGTAFADIIYADDPTLMPQGTTVRAFDIDVELPKPDWVAVSARIYDLPTGFSVVNGLQSGNDFHVAMDAVNPLNYNQLDLLYRYAIPDDSIAPDANGFYQTFTFSVEFLVDIGGSYTLVNGTARLAIGDAASAANITYENPANGNITYVLPKVPAGNIIDAGGGDDIIYGGAGSDTITGGAGTDLVSYLYSQSGVAANLATATYAGGYATGDTLTGVEGLEGSSHNDALTGDAGDNLLIGGLGADLLDGGAGFDTASFENAASAVSVDLGAGIGSAGEAAGDTYVNIERVVGSIFNDTLTGDAAANTLEGNDGDDVLSGAGGDDTLDGGTGDDTLIGGFGADQFIGGTGTDTVDYSTAAAGVTANLQTDTASGGEAAGDTFSGIERVVGSAFDDNLTGGATATTLEGGAGADTLIGGAANDTLLGGAGDDVLSGGGGADSLDGGAGFDAIDYSSSSSAVIIDMATGVGVGGDAQGDTFSNIERVIGSADGDVLIGTSAANTLEGGAGDDTLDGRGGADTLIGGAGVDTADYSYSGSGVTIDFAAGTGTGGDAEGDTLSQIERIVGSAYDDTFIGSTGDDVFLGNGGNDMFIGGAGADILAGGSGSDTADYSASTAININLTTGLATGGDATGDNLASIENIIATDFDDVIVGDGSDNAFYGGAGNDSLTGGAGADHLDGGTGTDTAYYTSSASAVTVDLGTGTGSGGDAAGDTLTGVENVTGSSLGDTLIGDAGDNILDGGAGDDRLEGGAGADQLIGGAGQDSADYTQSASAVTINLATSTATGGDADGDTFSSIERVGGSAFDDSLTGDSQANTLEGNAGNDILDGGAGDDTLLGGADDDILIGGAGSDTLTGGTGSDTADYSGSTLGVSVNLGAGTASGGDADGDILSEIENLTGTDQADTLIGNSGQNVLDGGAGDDTLEGGAGADTLIGGAGTDVADYVNSTSAVTVSLTSGTGIGGHAEGDTLSGIEDLSGSAFGDTLTGDANANLLRGQAGNDMLSGGAGDDTLEGGADDDTLAGGAGADSLDGGTGTDTIDYSASGSAVTINLSTSSASGGDAAGDTFTNMESVTGSVFADSLTGDAGDNTLTGGGGDDTLIGLAGADALIGGAGTDTADYSASASAVQIDLLNGTATGGDAAGDTFSSVENLTGSAGNDTLTGNTAANVLDGGDGDDVLAGGLGADTLIGGIGNDTAEYVNSNAAVTVDLSTGTGTGGHAEGDTLSGIEILSGSQFNDTLTGSANADTIYGNSGNDAIDGGDGDDTLSGGDGNDTLRGGAGADQLIGGNDTDIADYSGSSVSLTINLATNSASGGDATGDTFSGIEGVTGGTQADSLTGDAGNNILDGQEGDDLLIGGAGADTIIGGTGFDTVDFTASASGVNVDLTTGTGAGGDANGDTYSGIERVIGSAQADTLVGDTSDNTLEGAAGNDILRGGAGDDTLIGGADDDTLEGGAGADILTGGTGIDVVDYTGSDAAVTVNLATSSATGGHANGDTFTGIEGVIGSAFNDTITGDTSDNTLSGGGGDDIINGGDGNDTIDGGAGNDTMDGGIGADHFDGGTGTDTVDYASSAAGVNVDLALGSATGGEAQGDTFVAVENIIGSGFDDTISGNAFANTLTGGAGADTLSGAAGDDTLDGGDNDDILIGGSGADALTGGTGTDTASYIGSLSAVTVDLSTGTGTGGDAQGDTLTGIENLTGSSLDDTLIGDGGDNTLSGDAGNDTLRGGAGSDTLEGGAGTDLADYTGSASAVTVDLNAGTATGGDADGDTLNSIEGAIGSANNDFLYGDAGANVLRGGDGDDLLVGRGGADELTGGLGTDTADYSTSASAVTVDLFLGQGSGGDAQGDTLSGIENVTGSGGNDTLIGDASGNVLDGGAGNDNLTGGAGADTLTGGTGTDTANYSTSSAGVTVSLASGTGTGGDAQGDTLSGIENLTGSALNDTLTGDGNANTIDGGAGDDILVGGAGGDSLIGGTGNDIADYSASSAGVTINLAAGTASGGDAQGDTLTGIEGVIGSAQADNLTGDVNANTFDGGGGDDVISAGDGDDTIDGGAGADTITGGAGADDIDGGADTDTISFAASTQAVTVDLASGTGAGGDAQGDTYANIENVIGSNLGDTLIGDAGDNSLDGGSGDDILRGGGGADALIGGAGSDTADYTGSASAVTVNLGAGTASGGDAQGDTLSSIENIIGSANNDILTGDGSINRIEGGDGNDLISAGGGNDIIIGGAGDDTLIGGAGADDFDGGTGTDTLDYSASASAVTVNLTAGTGSGGDAQGDTMTGVENVIGSGLDDILTGDAGANALDGGAGNDTIAGLGGADTLTGGTGTDTLDYSADITGVNVNLATNAASGGDAAGDTISGFENVTGGSGNDTLTGEAGVNVIDGGAGNDTIEGGAGADTLTGNSGTDTLSYSGDTTGVTVNLSTSTASGGDAQGDTISGFENVTGGSGNDTLTGDAGVNVIDGGGGDDIIAGLAGADTLTGGTGTDTLDYSADSTGVIIDLGNNTASGGDAAGDTISGFENVTGGSQADTLTGDAGANVIDGSGGDDVIAGLAGADTLTGGTGTDTLDYSADTTGVTVNLATNAASGGDAAGDTISGFENVIGGTGDDTLTGTSGVNVLDGGAGDDLLIGGAGADTITGGTGTDTADYSASASAVTVNLATNVNTGGDAQGDSITGVENVIGSSYDDSLTGDAGDNIIRGGAGADTIDGGTGTDTADYTGSAAVTINLATNTHSGGDAAGDSLTGIENVYGSSFGDSLTGGAGVNELYGFDGDDTLDGGAGDDILDGGEGSDTYNWSLGEGTDTFTDTGTGVSDHDVINLVGSGGEYQLTSTFSNASSGIEEIAGDGDTETLGTATSGTALNWDFTDVTLTNVDKIQGSTVADVITGSAGDDLIEGGAGGDTLAGGAGTDTLSYSGDTTGVTVDLAANTASGGDAAGDTISGFENVTGGSGNDTLTGTAGVNIIDGGGGDDIIEGGAGGDTLTGGTGTDTLSYAGDSTGVTVDIASNTASGGDAAGDTISGFENVTGGSGNDTLTGTSAANVMSGGSGDDALKGGGGDDTIDGGAGANDTVVYDGLASNYIVTDLGGGVYSVTDIRGAPLDGTDTVSNVEWIQFSDGTFDIAQRASAIFGTENDDPALNGTAGNDEINALGGNDTITGGAGNDTIDGGAGTDTAVYSGNFADADITVDASGNIQVTTAADGTDTLTNVEYIQFDDRTIDVSNYIAALAGTTNGTTGSEAIIGDGTGNTINGSDGADLIIGADGNDVIDGGAGADEIRGDDGDDTITGGAGDDLISGGAGSDTAIFPGNFADAAIEVDGNGNILVTTAAGGTDTVNGVEFLQFDDRTIDVDPYIEAFTGTANGTAGSDVVIGSSNANTINGGNSADLLIGAGGNDVIDGGAGDDEIRGDDGDDTITGGAGADIMTGGTGADTLSYSTDTAGVAVNLSTNSASGGDAQGDTISGFENVTGGSGNDTLTGDANANVIDGGGGNDIIAGLGGADTLTGGTGTDTLDYSADTAGVTINLATNAASGGDAQGDTISGFENVTGGSGNDTLTGTSGVNVIDGGGGNDIIAGLAGADTLTGGTGTDTLDYSADSTGVTINLATNAASGGDAQGDTISGFENVTGGSGNDTLTGTSGANVISGGAGNDSLVGGAGDDVLSGGTGNDTIALDGGADTIDGGADYDILDVIVTTDVTVNLSTGIVTGTGVNGTTVTGIEEIWGGAGNDTYTGSANADTIYGWNGNDTIYGGGGADFLYGESGNDTIQGGAGADTLVGGSGTDTLDYSEDGTGVSINLATNSASGGNAAGDTISGFENVTGGSGNDTLTGDANANVITGNGGSDSIFGGGGNDTLSGGDESGSSGFRFRYQYFDLSGVSLNNLGDAGFTPSGQNANTPDGTGFINTLDEDNIPALHGGTGDDFALRFSTTLQVTSAGTYTFELASDDGSKLFVDGQEVIDWDGRHSASPLSGAIDLASGAHEIVIIYFEAGGGQDLSMTISGPDTSDVAVDIDSYGAVSADAGDFLSGEDGIDNITGGSGEDILFGGAGDDTLDGGAGDDTLAGGAGADVLTGGTGTDTLSYASDTAGVIVNLATNAASGGDAQGDTISGFENVIGGSAADTLTGDANANLIDGGEGDDVINGGAGGDTLFGGSGTDTLSYSGDTTGVVVDLAANTASGGHAAGDIISGFENVTGGSGNDTLTGSSDANVINGGSGDDTLQGGGGNDTIYGGAGTDTAVFSGNKANYTVSYNSGSDTYTVTDNRGGSPDGTDTVHSDVEYLQFADQTLAPVDALNSAPTDLQFTSGNTFASSGSLSLNQDGIDGQYAMVQGFSDFPTGSFSIELVVQGGFIADSPDAEVPLFSYATSGNSNEVAVLIRKDGTIYVGIDGNSVDSAPGIGSGLLDGDDHRFSLTWDSTSGDFKVYSDGSEIFTGNLSAGGTITAGGTLIFGQEQDSLGGGFDPNQQFVGTIDDVRIFNDVRTAGEVAANASAQFANPAGESGLVANFIFDTQADVEVIDAVGGHTMTLHNGAAVEYFAVNEDAAAGTVVAVLSTVDPDAGDTFTYSILNDPSNSFEIVGNELRVKTGATLDFEGTDSYTLTIQSQDSGGETVSGTVKIDITNAFDEAPAAMEFSGNTGGLRYAPTMTEYSHPDLSFAFALNEGSGSTATALDGTTTLSLLNGATWTSGPVGEALNFSGGTDNTGAQAQLTPFVYSGAMTFSTYARFDDIVSGTKSWQRLFDFGTQSTDVILAGQSSNTDDMRFEVYVNGVNHTVTATDAIVEGEWAHWTFTVNEDGVMRIYKNGVVLAENENGAAPDLDGAGTARIGASNWMSDDSLDGAIADFTVHRDDLSAAEVSELYNHSAVGLDSAYASDFAGTEPVISGEIYNALSLNADGATDQYAVKSSFSGFSTN